MSWRTGDTTSTYRSRSPSRYSYGESSRAVSSSSRAPRPPPTSHRFASISTSSGSTSSSRDDAWTRGSSHYNPREPIRTDTSRNHTSASYHESGHGAYERTSSSSSYAGRGRGRGRGGYGGHGVGYGYNARSSSSRFSRDDDHASSRDSDAGEYRSSRYADSRRPSLDRSHYANESGWESRSYRSDTRDRRDKDRQEDAEPGPIDWAEVESKARANGLIVPGDIVEEYKRQGHFDLLRRQLLSTYQSSKQTRVKTQSDISDLLTSYFQANPYEAAKIAKMGDVRLQHSECMRILDMHDPPRAKIKRVEQDMQEAVEVIPSAGPDLMRQLLDRLHAEGGEDGFEGVLSEKADLGRSLSDHIGQLLKEEMKDGERKVAPPTQEQEDGRSTAAAREPQSSAINPSDHAMALQS